MFKLPENFCLDRFIGTYIAEALRLAEGDPLTNDFYNSLYEGVSSKFGISREAVLHLHHPFHWVLFGNNHPDSPLEYVQTNNHGVHVRIKRPYTDIDASELANTVSSKYGGLLREKMKSPEQRERELEDYRSREIEKIIQRS